MGRRVLVTGSGGCLGAWSIRHLLEDGHEVVALDLSTDRSRIEAVVGRGELRQVTFVRADLADTAQVLRALERQNIDAILHLAALQVPFCRADPPRGMRVNVEGSANVFEAAVNAQIPHVAYASSAAVYGPAQDYPPGLVDDSMPKLPRTAYGVTKVANELMARVYHGEHGLTSTALRPYTVYGVGRDQGLTSEPTLAMAAAARGQSFTISFGGSTQMHWASDTARQFIDAALNPGSGAEVFDLGGPVVSIREIADVIEELVPGVRVGVGDGSLPFAAGFDGAALRASGRPVFETPLVEGIGLTLEAFRNRG